MENEEYSSDSSDEDYIPTEGNLVSEEENSGEDEEVIFNESGNYSINENNSKTNKKKHINKKGKKKTKKKNVFGGSGLTVKACNDDIKVLEKQNVVEEQSSSKSKNVPCSEDNCKKSADSLWADFTKGVEKVASKNNIQKHKSDDIPNVNGTKVTIVKEFDFAGEIVRVTSQVAANSKEAKLAEERNKNESISENNLKTNGISDNAKMFDSKVNDLITKPSINQKSVPENSNSLLKQSSGNGLQNIIGVKRPVSGLPNVLDRLNKKPKISILEKSKLDWSGFKREEGIDEELTQHNRGKKGYLERMAFLQRTDYRQYEIERDMRMTKKTTP